MKHYYCGIDVGSNTAKTAIIDEKNRILGFSIVKTGANSFQSAGKALQEALEAASLNKDAIKNTVSTGYGRKQITYADTFKTEISCHALGVSNNIEDVKTLIDIGGQDSKVIKLGKNGRVLDFAMNDKCAAGSGRFLEVIAHSLGISLVELGENALASSSELMLSNTCTVFAESEVISLVSKNAPLNDICRAVCRAIATRVAGLANRMGTREKAAISGGVALNTGIIAALEETLGVKIFVPENPQLTGAFGAALFAKNME